MSTATFTPARHRSYKSSRRNVRQAEALSPARGMIIGLGLSSALWVGIALLFF